MKTLLLTMLLILPLCAEAQEASLSVMFMNLENFFDYHDGGEGESDHEFSSNGPRHWTRRRFNAKCNSFAKTVLWAGTVTGRLPDVIGVAEVENAFVLKRILSNTILRKLDYRYVHYDSPDPRGIDCALFYRRGTVALLSSKACRVDGNGLRTRDILLAQMLVSGGDSIAVLVNHMPSKYGGAEDWRREVAVARLKALSDSLASEGWLSQLAIGDFNDTPDSPLFDELMPALRFCRRTGTERGSIRFNGQWELIDLCFVSASLSQRSSFRVLAPPFLTTRDAAHSGEKPLRTYSGPRYLGGISDHYPIHVTVKRKE